MKKSIRITALVLLTVLLALSCTVAVAFAADEISDIIDEASEAAKGAEFPAEIPEQAPALPQVGIVADEETTITATDHLYEQEKLLLVTAENLADTVYSVNVNVTYYGENGDVIDTETQSYDQLEKGFPKNFIFRPGYDFVDYLLTIEKTAFEGETWRNDLIGEFGFSWWSPWDENDNWSGRPHMELKNRSEITRIMKDVSTVIFDENGEIYMILDRKCECWISTGMESNYKHFAENVYVTGDMIHYEDSTWVQPASGGIRPAPKFTYFTAFGVIKPEESETYDFVVSNGYYTPGE